MKESVAAQEREKTTVVKLVSADVLVNPKDEIDGMIARHAYELSEKRKGVYGYEVADWHQAEDDIMHSCCDDLRESTEAIILRAEMPCSYTAAQLCVSVEPRRLVVRGEREVDVSYWDGVKTRTDRRPQRIFRAHNLPAEVNPSTSTAILRGDTLEVVMPKAEATKKPGA